MNINLLHAVRAIADPTPDALGYDLNAELRKAAKAALKPILKKLLDYRAKEVAVTADRDSWSRASYDRIVEDIRAAAAEGDADAILKLRGGGMPSPATFDDQHGRCCRELDLLQREAAPLFREAAALLAAALPPVVAKGQSILDRVLKNYGIPRHELVGHESHVGYVVKNLRDAGIGGPATSDLCWFWSAVES